MLTAKQIKTITDMREDAVGLLEEVANQGIVYLFQHSNPRAVMLSLEEFERLQELVEDHLDELEAVKLAKEKRGKGVSLKTILARYKKKSRV